MLKTFDAIRPFIKYDPLRVTIDNFVFKLHYRVTFLVLLLFTILVCSQQYFGSHIQCITGSIPSHVINTYCFFTPTFTLVRHLNNSLLKSNVLFEPGIGPYETEDEPIKRHAYYQWVPFVLFLQALTFLVPHKLWKSWEGGRIKALVFGLKMTGLSQYINGNSHQHGKLPVPTMQHLEERVKEIRRAMIDRMRLNQSWGAHLVFAEILNLLNLLIQIYFTNIFLNGAFFSLGLKVIDEKWIDKMDALDIVFPKVTKCHFRKFGPSGSLQLHDTLCVMALNIINEKIFTVLWFWYLILLFFTVCGLLWRIFTIFFYSSDKFTEHLFYYVRPGRINKEELKSVVMKCNFSNWMFLLFLRENLSEFLFKRVIYHLSSELHDVKMQNRLNANIYDSQMSTKNMDNKDQVEYPLLPAKMD